VLTNVPSDATLIALLTAIASTVSVLVGETVAVNTATTPLPIVLSFVPIARHITAPALELQLNVFPAAVNAGPAAKLTEVRSVGE